MTNKKSDVTKNLWQSPTVKFVGRVDQLVQGGDGQGHR